MSRFYELIQKLGSAPEASTLPARPSSSAAPSEFDEILSTIDAVTAIGPRPAGRSSEARHAPDHFPVQRVHLAPDNRLVAHSEPGSPAADRYRFLRARLRTLWTAGKLKKLLITSPLPRDGKTTVASNLATTLAENGKYSVLLIDADLHHCAATKAFGLDTAPGLAECLENHLNPFSTITSLDPLSWHLLPSGRTSLPPAELLQRDAMAALVERLAARFDWILMDGPPILPLSDACLLSQHVDGALMVVRAGETSVDATNEAIETFGRKNLVGLVLNGATQLGRSYGRYGRYYRQKE
jgi:capsular exopolysaccharide synthesis family protein